MDARLFDELATARILDFRNAARAQRMSPQDMLAAERELERRLDRIRKAMSIDIHTDEQLPGCWVATDSNSYGGPGSPIGSGSTEQDAIDDLLDQLQDE